MPEPRLSSPRLRRVLGGVLALALVLVAPLIAIPAAAAVDDDAVGAVVRDQNLIAASAGGLGIGAAPPVYYQAFAVAVTGTLTSIDVRGYNWNGTPTLEVRQLVNGVPLGTTLATSVGTTGNDIKSFDLGAGLAVTAGDTLGFKVTANSGAGVRLTYESYAPGSLYYSSVPYSYPLPMQFATYVQQAAPGSVTTLAAAAGDRSSTVSWSAPTGVPTATHYQIDYRLTGTTAWTSFGSTAATSATLTGLAGGAGYDIAVRSVDAAGGVSARSIAAVTPFATATAPLNLAATAGDTTLALTWDAPADVGTSPLLHYVMHLSSADDGEFFGEFGPISTTFFSVHNLPNGRAMDVRVHAVTAQGDGAGAVVSATPDALPEAPLVESTTEGTDLASLVWSVPANSGSAIQTYQVELTRGGLVTVTDVATTAYSVPGAVNDEPYELRVRAVNAMGAGPWSAATTLTPYAKPGAPDDLALTMGDKQLTASWMTPTGAGASAITHYSVMVTGPGSTTTTLTAAGSPFVITGLTNGAQYAVSVLGVTAGGPGESTAAVTKTPSALPEAPMITGVMEGDDDAAIEWDTPVSDGSTISAFEVELTRDGVTSVTTVLGVNRYSVPGAANGEPYPLRVRAVNAAGAGLWSSAVTLRPRTVADVPTVVVLVPGNASATLTWDAPASDGGAPILGYTVRYREVGSLAWSAIDVTAATAVVGSLGNGVAYEFGVSARNAAGWSEFSAAVPTVPFAATVQFNDANGAILPGARLLPGTAVSILVADLPEGAIVTLQLGSTTLGTVAVGPSGIARIAGVIPLNAAAGAHNLVASVTSDGVTQTAERAIEVVVAPVAVLGSLVVTGTDVTAALVIAGGLLLAGRGLVVLRRQRSHAA